MSLTVLQTPGTINPYAESTQQVLGGINQLVEQDAINRALARVNQGEMDPLSAILGTQMPAARQNQLVNAFQNQRQLENQQAAAIAKAQPKSDKVGEKFLESHMNDVEELSNLRLGLSEIEEAVTSGNVSPRIVSGSPIAGIKGKFAPTEADQKLKDGVKKYLTIAKKIFGANVAREQSALLLDMFPQPGKSEAENMAALEDLKNNFQMLEQMLNVVEEDEAIQEGTVTAKDVARINKRKREVVNEFFNRLSVQKQIREEMQRRGL